jgi:small subunit ribosomal protein S16
MVVIRLTRGGAKKRPFYHIVATDRRSRRDGRYIQRLGYFNPIAKGQEPRLKMEREQIQQWLDKGAELSQKVQELVKEWDKAAA